MFRKVNILGIAELVPSPPMADEGIPEIAEPVPNEVRNLLACFGLALQPIRSSQ